MTPYQQAARDDSQSLLLSLKVPKKSPLACSSYLGMRQSELSDDEKDMLALDHPGEEELFDQSRSALYNKRIFPLLLKVGFVCKNISYSYKDEIVGTEDDVQKWLCLYGIPNRSSLTEEEFLLLTRWVAYAHVLHSAFTSDYAEYNDNDIANVLIEKLKFTWEKKGVLISADKRVKGHLQDIRTILRREGISGVSRRATAGNLTAEERGNLQVWAARSKRPLPSHPDDNATVNTLTSESGAKKSTGSPDSSIESHGEVNTDMKRDAASGGIADHGDAERPKKRARREETLGSRFVSWFNLKNFFGS